MNSNTDKTIEEIEIVETEKKPLVIFKTEADFEYPHSTGNCQIKK